MITQTTPRDSSWNLFYAAYFFGGRRPIPPEICAQSDPLSNTTISTNPLLVSQP